MNPYSATQSGYRKWEWLNERKAKSTPIEAPMPQCSCGCHYVNKYRAHYYCRKCGARMNRSAVEKHTAKE